MKIVVCVKRVPATDTRVKIGADGRSIDTAQVEWIISPYDEFAVECALRLKDKDASTTVTVLSLGPAETTKELRTCLAMGADDAILLKDPQAGARDASSTAAALADAVRGLSPDLVLLGKQAVDRDQGQVGLLLAGALGLPCVTEIRKFELAGTLATVERAGEDGTAETWEVALPAVLTCTKGLNEPRYANLKGIMAAKKKPIDERDAPAAAGGLQTRALELPPTRSEGKIVGEGPDAVPELVRLLQQEAKVL